MLDRVQDHLVLQEGCRMCHYHGIDLIRQARIVSFEIFSLADQLEHDTFIMAHLRGLL